MSEKHAGVQAILREKHMPRAIYVHCYAHRLNWVICDVSKIVPYLAEFYSVLFKVHAYFSSNVTHEGFISVQKELNIGKIISFNSSAESRIRLVFLPEHSRWS